MSTPLPRPIDAKPENSRRLSSLLVRGIVGLFAIVGIAFAALLAFSFRSLEVSEEAGIRGGEFGVSATDANCFANAVSDLDVGWGGSFDQDEAEYLRECLKVAAPTENFCAGVPFPSDTERSKQWYEELDEAIGCPSDFPCVQIAGAIQYHCLERGAGGE